MDFNDVDSLYKKAKKWKPIAEQQNYESVKDYALKYVMGKIHTHNSMQQREKAKFGKKSELYGHRLAMLKSLAATIASVEAESTADQENILLDDKS